MLQTPLNLEDLEEEFMVLVEDLQDLETQVVFLHLKEIQADEVHNIMAEAEEVQVQLEMQVDQDQLQEDQAEVAWM